MELDMRSKLNQFCDVIVTITGFLLIYGVVGALDEAPDDNMLALFVLGMCGLILTFAGVNGLTRQD